MLIAVVSGARDFLHRLLSGSGDPADLPLPQHGAGHQGLRQVERSSRGHAGRGRDKGQVEVEVEVELQVLVS